MDIYIYKTKQHRLKSRSLEIPELYQVTGKIHKESCEEATKPVFVAESKLGLFLNEGILQGCNDFENTVPAGNFKIHKTRGCRVREKDIKIRKVELYGTDSR